MSKAAATHDTAPYAVELETEDDAHDNVLVPVHLLLPTAARPNDDEHWIDKAICSQTDPEVFFPEAGKSRTVAAARRVCAGCEVKVQCKEWAIAAHEKGIWGGTTDSERAEIRRQRTAEQNKDVAA